jgi:hypothetical protein
VTGDFNSQLARSDKHNEFNDRNYVGRWSIHSRDNVGGKLLRELMHRTSICAISTMFQPPTNKTNATWINPQINSKPCQIDYILVCHRRRRWVTNCTTKWGRSFKRWGMKKDHTCVTAIIKSSISVPQQKKQIFDVSRPVDPEVKEKYAIDVRNFLRNKPIPETSEGVWLRIKEAVLPSAEKNLRPLRIPHNVKSKFLTEQENGFQQEKSYLNQL